MLLVGDINIRLWLVHANMDASSHLHAWQALKEIQDASTKLMLSLRHMCSTLKDAVGFEPIVDDICLLHLQSNQQA